MKYTKYIAALPFMLAAFTSCSEDTLPTNILPGFITGDATEITRVSAILSGGIQSNAVENMTEYGIIVSDLASMPDDPTATRRIPVKSSPESMIVLADGLQMNRNYYYAPYASCGYNLVKGEVRNFVTLSTSAPSISITEDALSPTSTSCTVKARIDDAGSDKIGTRKGLFMRGFIYKAVDGGDNTNFKSTDAGVTMVTYDQDDAEFTQTISNLTPGTTYAVRPFGVLNGVGYGIARNFTTTTVSEPSLSTIELSNTIGTSVQLKARVIDKGTDNVIEKGFCYSSTNDLPTIDNSHVVDDTQGEDIQVVLSGLDAGTTYYIRAYAVNGTKESPRYGYGEVQKYRVNDDFSYLDAYYTKEEVDAILMTVDEKVSQYNNEASAAIEKLREEDEKLRKDDESNLSQATSLYNELSEQTKNNISDITSLQQELAKAKGEYEDKDRALQAMVDNTSKELDAKIQEKASKQEMLETINANQSQTNELVEQNRKALKEDIDKLTKDITDLQGELKMLQDNHKALQDEYTKKMKEIDDAIKELNDAMGTQAALLESLSNKVDGLLKRVETLESDVDGIHTTIVELQQQLSDAKSTIPMPVVIGNTDFTVLGVDQMQAAATIDYTKYCKGYNDIYGISGMYGEEYYASLYPIVMTGFVISSAAPNPNIENCERMIVATADKAAGTISFSSTIQSLTPGATYYVRAFAINSFGTNYSDVKTIKMVVEPGSNDNPFPEIKNIKRHNIRSNE